MKCGTLVLPAERARHFINVIGRESNIEFKDMHAGEMIPNRPYKKYLQRIEEVERIIRFLFEEVNKIPGVQIHKNEVDGFLDTANNYDLSTVEDKLKSTHADFTKFKENNTNLIIARNAAVEEKHVAEFAAQSVFVGGRSVGPTTDTFESLASQALLEEGKADSVMFSHIAGVLSAEDQQRFARFLFRATRGNSFCNFQDIPEQLVDPSTGKKGRRSVFVIYFQDARVSKGSSAMYSRIERACLQFGVNVYSWPGSGDEARKKLKELGDSASEKDRALVAFEQFMFGEVRRLLAKTEGGNSLLEEYRLFAIKEKSIYYTLNLFTGTNTIRCDAWYPKDEENELTMLLGKESAGGMQGNAMLVVNNLPAGSDAPTYFKGNEFTAAFQEVIFTYGVPRYGEASPVLLTIVTFPFIFGIMYGDIGHGTLLLLFGIYLVWTGEKNRYTNPPLFLARYMIMMMGFFATYAGFLYNDMFSLGLDLFGSRWSCQEESGLECEPLYDIYNGDKILPNGDEAPKAEMTQYPFGVDPAWSGSTNELIYMNSLKMKLSVVVGVVQMLAGLMLRFSNAIHERSVTNFVFECIPMLIFMVCFFGWMDYLILFKWVNPIGAPPSIINSLICMAMFQPDATPMWPGADVTSKMMMAIAMLSIPFLLFPKPIIIYIQHRMKKKNTVSPGDYQPLEGGDSGGHGHGEDLDMAEIVIHQVIETIEYVLGTVSHTASYLRQWALSLAHQQLSLVFFQKTLTMALSTDSPWNCVYIYIGFCVWFAITMAVLLGMDVLECFLHTLRLHWVEFQSKFYKADGREFAPYKHIKILTAQEDS